MVDQPTRDEVAIVVRPRYRAALRATYRDRRAQAVAAPLAPRAQLAVCSASAMQDCAGRGIADAIDALAERVGFEPTVPHRGTTVFETAPIDRSGTSPVWPRLIGAPTGSSNLLSIGHDMTSSCSTRTVR